jgi:hypothetical protein
MKLVAELTERAPEFRGPWERNDVRGKTREAKTFRHAAGGGLNQPANGAPVSKRSFLVDHQSSRSQNSNSGRRGSEK